MISLKQSQRIDEAYIKLRYEQLKKLAKERLISEDYIYDESIFQDRNEDAMFFIEKYQIAYEQDKCLFLFLSYLFGKNFLDSENFEFERCLIENQDCLLSEVFDAELIDTKLESSKL